jgi:hypothetical protein
MFASASSSRRRLLLKIVAITPEDFSLGLLGLCEILRSLPVRAHLVDGY